jgi:hypothetical protein
MIIEKYFGIDREAANQMINETKNMNNVKSGNNDFQNTKVFLFNEYAVLKMKNIDIRNVDIQDRDLKYLEMLAISLIELEKNGVNVIPILAFQNNNGNGYIIQKKAKGAELYDRDKIMEKRYVLERVELLSNAPQKHFDKFISDAIKIIEAGLLIDFIGKDNFFYHNTIGFQFIDLNAHFDYIYGCSNEKPASELIVIWNCFLPCYYDTMPEYHDTVSNLMLLLTDNELIFLKEHNRNIFEKVKKAMLHNGITKDNINEIIMDKRFIPQKNKVF